MDFLRAVGALPEVSVQCVVTSTPYWGMRIYKDACLVRWADGEECGTSLLYGTAARLLVDAGKASDLGALGGTRTPNLLIRSQMLYPLSYERTK